MAEWVVTSSGIPESVGREPDFGSRILARLADMLLMLPVLVLLASLDSGEFTIFPTSRWANVVLLLVSAIYEIVAISVFGKTVGKRLLGLVVIDRSTGAMPDVLRAAIRWAVYSTGSILGVIMQSRIGPLIPILIVAPALRPPLHLGIHDYAARSIVVARSNED